MLVLSVGVESSAQRPQPRLHPTQCPLHEFIHYSAAPHSLRIWVDRGSLEPPAQSLAGLAPRDIEEGYGFLQTNSKLSFEQRSR